MSLPERIQSAIKALDDDTTNIAEQMPALSAIRGHQQILSSLLAEAASVVAQAERNTVATYVTRRRQQAQRFRNARTEMGMTAKDAEEESKLFAKEAYETELGAIEHHTLLQLLIRALRSKIDFARDVANDLKHVEKAFTSNNP